MLSLACDLPAGRCGDCMAACTALVTAAVSVAVKAPISMFVLGSVAGSGEQSLLSKPRASFEHVWDDRVRCCRTPGAYEKA